MAGSVEGIEGVPIREIITPAGVPLPSPTFSAGVKFGRWMFASGQLATDYQRGLVPEVRGNTTVPLAGEDPVILESRYIFEVLGAILEAGGTSLPHAVRLQQWPTARGVMDPYHVERREFLHAPRPASTSVEISGLMVPECTIEVELVAIVPEDGFRKEGITTDAIPQPLGGYAPAIRAGDFVFVAGQVPTDWRTGVAPEARVDPIFWEGSAIDRQARYTLRNLQLTLEAAGSSPANVVKAQVYLTDLGDLPRLERVWREFFPEQPPARTVVPVRALAVLDARIEIDLVALVDGGRTRKEVVSTDRAPRPLFHQAQAVRTGDLLFLSGLLAADESGLVAAARVNPHYPYAGISAEAQMQHIVEQAAAVCEAAGTDVRHGLRLQTFHTDLREYEPATRVRRAAFPDGQPAATTLQVPGALQVPGCTVLADLWVGVS